MYPTQYKRPSSLEEAVALLADMPEARPVAGGQSLIAAMKLRFAVPSAVIDLGHLPGLSSIEVGTDEVVIGAMVRHAAVASSPELAATVPALCALAAGIGDRQVRNMGTMGGSVANNDPAADYPAAVLAMNGVVNTNLRSIAADDFFLGIYETALEPGELITSIVYKVPRRAAYIKFKNPASRFALVGLFLADYGSSVRMAVTGAGAGVFRLVDMESALGANFVPEALDGIPVPPDRLSSDIHASAEYRAHLITVMAKRAVQVAIVGQTGPAGEWAPISSGNEQP
ncbi:MAG: xanthine dehydrogenase family protein subunit M [Pigmentiphaga sp.]|uniref:FAD binding domain-containing protein n=1 Tax=Pigmentiphaga sp. TaxID=1977564 RepID=UPI0029B8B1A6|nr:xanthine dehydrogenase family protein subunit M [Pigmentiphaga sp.]MDX3905967.1 xanthine dehydrogenase family protein subunit M [Pigmentiphaga sp.]